MLAERNTAFSLSSALCYDEASEHLACAATRMAPVTRCSHPRLVLRAVALLALLAAPSAVIAAAPAPVPSTYFDPATGYLNAFVSHQSAPPGQSSLLLKSTTIGVQYYNSEIYGAAIVNPPGQSLASFDVVAAYPDMYCHSTSGARVSNVR
jgi:hypothetical protein